MGVVQKRGIFCIFLFWLDVYWNKWYVPLPQLCLLHQNQCQGSSPSPSVSSYKSPNRSDIHHMPQINRWQLLKISRNEMNILKKYIKTKKKLLWMINNLWISTFIPLILLKIYSRRSLTYLLLKGWIWEGPR